MNVAGDDFDLERGQHGSGGGDGWSGGDGGNLDWSFRFRLGFRSVRFFVDGRVRLSDERRCGLELRMVLWLDL